MVQVEVVLIVAIACSRGPPVAVVSIVERAIAVAPASNRRKSGSVTSAGNTTEFIVGWQSPAFRADIVGCVLLGL